MRAPCPWLSAALLLASILTFACQLSGPADEPREPTESATATESWFTDISDEVGLDFVHESGGAGELHLPEIMGSGVGFLDYDGDGDLDIYVISGNYDFAGNKGSAEDTRELPTNRLYAQGDDGLLVDVTAESGVGDGGYGMGMAVGDYDNDGDVDLYVTNLGSDRLYRNRGDGTFENVTESAGIAVGGWSTSAAFLDYDQDGWLDLYVTRYVTYDPTTKCYDFAGRHEYCGPTAFSAESDVLLHNEGDGTFRDSSHDAGITAIADAGLGVVCADFDGDGLTDIYVANDADPNQLWINRGDGTFADHAALLGASVNAFGAAEAGMGVLAADFDNDLDADLFLTHLKDESNTLYLNLGEGIGFEDSTTSRGLARSPSSSTARKAGRAGGSRERLSSDYRPRSEPRPGAPRPGSGAAAPGRTTSRPGAARTSARADTGRRHRSLRSRSGLPAYRRARAR